MTPDERAEIERLTEAAMPAMKKAGEHLRKVAEQNERAREAQERGQ